MKDLFAKIFENKKRVMCVFAHPDDLEVYAGGTVSRLIKNNIKVQSIKVTNGNRGSRDQREFSHESLSIARASEDKSAMQILGLKSEDSINLEINDGDVENSHHVISLIAKQIRIFKPDLIITHNPEDVIIKFSKGENWVNHRDHRNTGKSAVDAAYPYSRDLLFFPEHFQDPNAQSHTVSEFLFVDYYDHPDCVDFDITDFVDTKISALASHVSQFSKERAVNMVEFLNRKKKDQFAERFRYVLAD